MFSPSSPRWWHRLLEIFSDPNSLLRLGKISPFEGRAKGQIPPKYPGSGEVPTWEMKAESSSGHSFLSFLSFFLSFLLFIPPVASPCARPPVGKKNISFGTTQDRKMFPYHFAPDRLGIEVTGVRGSPWLGPGCYLGSEVSSSLNFGLFHSRNRVTAALQTRCRVSRGKRNSLLS